MKRYLLRTFGSYILPLLTLAILCILVLWFLHVTFPSLFDAQLSGALDL